MTDEERDEASLALWRIINVFIDQAWDEGPVSLRLKEQEKQPTQKRPKRTRRKKKSIDRSLRQIRFDYSFLA